VDELIASLSGLLPFLVSFALSLVALLLFKVVYTWLTPHDEWRLIREAGNTAAAVAFAGALCGFALPLASAAAHSAGVLDFGLWALVALSAQVLAFVLLRLLFLRDVFERIDRGEMSAAVVLAATSLAIGILNAACMSA